MRVAVADSVEVRIARKEVEHITGGMHGRGVPETRDIYVTKAMTVRLRAPKGGFWIEMASPETQWTENALGLLQDDFASWRWTVTPQRRGRATLQLIVSARTVGPDGVAADTALPDQVVEVRVKINYGRSAKRAGGWAAAAIAGGVLARYGEGLVDMVSRFL